VHALGRAALDAGELLGVVGELEDVLGPRAAGELRVDDLVGAVGKALEEVGDPAPAVVLEAGLVDDVCFVSLDGGFSLCCGCRLEDGETLRPEASR